MLIRFNFTGNEILSIHTWVDFLSGIATIAQASVKESLGEAQKKISSIFENKKPWESSPYHLPSWEDHLKAMRRTEQFYNLKTTKAPWQGNCLTWTQRMLFHSGIELPSIDTTLAVPDEYIARLSSQPSLVKFYRYTELQ
jgi:hypothetical protein